MKHTGLIIIGALIVGYLLINKDTPSMISNYAYVCDDPEFAGSCYFVHDAKVDECYVNWINNYLKGIARGDALSRFDEAKKSCGTYYLTTQGNLGEDTICNFERFYSLEHLSDTSCFISASQEDFEEYVNKHFIGAKQVFVTT